MKKKIMSVAVVAMLAVSASALAAHYPYFSSKSVYGRNTKINYGYHHVLREKMIPDGRYYSGVANKQYHKNNDIIAIRTIEVYQPVILNFHAIGHGTAHVNHTLYDMDQNTVGKKINPQLNSVDDEFMIVGPGFYELKSDIYSIKRDAYTEYRIKAEAEVIEANAPAEIYRPDYAHRLSLGMPVINYMPYNKNYSDKHQYYSFDLYNGREVRLLANVMKGSCRFEILDMDERVISSASVYNKIAEKNIYLAPGKYYVRVYRYDRDGAVYKLRVE